MHKQFRFRYVKEITGAFVLLSIALLIGGIVMTGTSQRWFTKMRSYTIDLPEQQGAMGLKPGADVWILGSVVGTVEEIEAGEGRMRAQVVVRSDFGRYVRADSSAYIRKTLGIGDPYIEILRDPELVKLGPGVELSPGGTIRAEADLAPGEMLQETIKQVQEAINEIRKEALPAVREARLGLEEYKNLAADLRKPDGNLQSAIGHLNNIAAAVDRGDGLAGKILSDPAMAKQGEESIKQVRAVLGDLEKTAAALPDTVRSINRTADALPALVLQMQETLRQAQRTVEGMQRSWLLKGTVEGDAGSGRIRPEDAGGR